jgi:hypothetical protein
MDSYLSPGHLDILLDVLPQPLRLFKSGEVPAAFVLLIRDNIASLLEHMPDSGEQLVREETEADGLGDVGEVHAGCAVELTIRLEGGEDARGEPVERDVGQNVREVGRGVGPFEEFLADPGGPC